MGLVQSISEAGVKSCIGTKTQVDLGLCCVAFLIPSKARENFVFIYLSKLAASSSFLYEPILRNVSVVPMSGVPMSGVPMSGVPMSGVERTSPKAPEPLALLYIFGLCICIYEFCWKVLAIVYNFDHLKAFCHGTKHYLLKMISIQF